MLAYLVHEGKEELEPENFSVGEGAVVLCADSQDGIKRDESEWG